MLAHDRGGRDVHQIPVVHAWEMREVEAKDLFSFGGLSTLEPAHQDQEREEPFLMPGRGEQPLDLRKLHLVGGPRLPAQRRNRDSEKPVALAVLAWPCLEEPG